MIGGQDAVISRFGAMRDGLNAAEPLGDYTAGDLGLVLGMRVRRDLVGGVRARRFTHSGAAFEPTGPDGDSSPAAYALDTVPAVRKRDEAQHGESGIARVILDVYDRMADAARTGVLYAALLDPPLPTSPYPTPAASSDLIGRPLCPFSTSPGVV
jgi:hypothetical protein